LGERNFGIGRVVRDSTSVTRPLHPKAGSTCAPSCACKSTFDASNQLVGCEERYLISSLPRYRLTTEHWLLVLRRHWGVETSHQVLDGAFAEDDHPLDLQKTRAALS
jgi:hypothetical protein